MSKPGEDTDCTPNKTSSSHAGSNHSGGMDVHEEVPTVAAPEVEQDGAANHTSVLSLRLPYLHRFLTAEPTLEAGATVLTVDNLCHDPECVSLLIGNAKKCIIADQSAIGIVPPDSDDNNNDDDAGDEE